MEPVNTSSIFAALPSFFAEKNSKNTQAVELRLPVPVGAVPAETKAFQQFGGIPETGTHRLRPVGIGTNGEDLAAAFFV